MLTRSALVIVICLTVITAAAGVFTTTACAFIPAKNFAAAEKGFVKGKVTDSQGNPLQGVKILIDHSIFYNSNITTTTDAAGNYRIKVPTGSWYAFAMLKKTYNGKTYEFYLKPDSYAGFGGEGTVRNFLWALTGEKEAPLAKGFFGGTITIDKAIGGGIIQDFNEIEFTLTPIGNLIDGSQGKTLKIRSKDGYNLHDVPIGKYNITASYQRKNVGLSKWNNSDEAAKNLEIDFEPQIAAKCDNCVKLEYHY